MLVSPDVTGGNPVRTVVQSTQANDEGAPSNKDAQVFVLSDPTTPANMLAVDSAGRATVIVPDIATSGSLAALNATLALVLSGQSSASIQITGTFVGTIAFEVTRNGTDWVPVNAVQAGQSTFVQSITGVGAFTGLFSINVAARAQVQVKMTAFTSGSASIAIGASVAVGPIYVTQVLPVAINAGTATIGATRPAPAATGTITSPALAVTSFTVLAANANRLGATIYNDSTVTAYIALAPTASLTSFTIPIVPGGYYELPNDGTIFTGLVSGIAASATGNLRVTETTV